MEGILQMRLPLGWLQEYVPVPWSAEELAERLTMAGIAVDAVERPVRELDGVVVGEITAIEAHPVREGLRVCQVSVAGAAPHLITSVTGAPNAAPGARVPVALPGARLAGRDGAVAEVAFDGVISGAVLCSEAELGLGSDATGLWLLPPDAPVGERLARALGLDQPVLVIDVYPNRPDCLSVVGIAREVAALTGTRLELPAVRVPESGRPVGERWRVRVAAEDLCPRYMGRVIEGVTIGPAPLWMQARLRASGMRPINNVVDVTNYVMLELGQPLHAFDAATLRGNEIRVRRAEDGEKIVTLDGAERTLDAQTLVIAAEDRPVAIAGVMGSADSEVRAETRTIFLESAAFDPGAVRRAARRLGLRTEASLRFEKGFDLHRCAEAIDRAAALLAQIAGGRVVAGRIDERAAPLPEPRRLTIRPRRVNAMLGTALSPAEMKRLLKNLQWEVEIGGDGQLDVEVPLYRRDIEREADVVEEIARLYGYDRIPATLPQGTTVVGGSPPHLTRVERLRAALIDSGLSEAITNGLIDPDAHARLGLSPSDPRGEPLRLRNPLARAMSALRPLLAVGLLDALAVNAAHHNPAAHLFEIGTVFSGAGGPMPPEERLHLGLALMGPRSLHWKEKPEEPDFFDLKGYVELACDVLGAAHLRIVPGVEPFLHPGRSAQIVADEAVIGFLGELDPRIARLWRLPGRPLLAEIDLKPLLSAEPPAPAFTAPPRFPGISRDIALLVPEEVPSERVTAAIRQLGQPLVQEVRLFDV
ncbi:MAG TPA: phenylalanine--tRNA ligase subunit beta, partial [Limnochordia bacterium]